MQTGEKLGPVDTTIIITNHIDLNNHLTNTAWGLHLETGRLKTAVEYGLNINIPLRQMRIKFRGQIFKEDEIRIRNFAIIGEEFIEFNQSMNRDRDNKVVGIGSSRYGNYPLDTGLPLKRTISELVIQLDKMFETTGAALHYLTALWYFEQTRVRLLSERGIDMEKERKERGIRFMVASLEAKYLEAMYPGQQVTIRTSFDTYIPQLIFHQEMVSDGQVLTKADTACVLVDRADKLVNSLAVINPIKRKLDQISEEA